MATKEIKTDVDKLLNLVDEKRDIDAKEASQLLDIKEGQIREWADFLERHGLIDLKLNFFHLRLVSKKRG